MPDPGPSTLHCFVFVIKIGLGTTFPILQVRRWWHREDVAASGWEVGRALFVDTVLKQ